MSFRHRLALVSAAAVAVVVVVGSFVSYGLVRSSMRGEIDESLRGAATRVGRVSALPAPPGAGLRRLLPRAGFDEAPIAGALVDPGGDVTSEFPAQAAALPAGEAAGDVAAGARDAYFEDREIDGVHARVFTAPAAAGRAIVVARSLTEVDEVLGDLRLGLLLLVFAGVGAAAVLARVAAGAAIKPVAELTATAEHVAATHDLTKRIRSDGGDEIARLARSFNTMLEALDSSRRAQRQLVADASHELRTPLTSLRTNMEVLADAGALAADDRERLRADVVAQLEELTLLVGDLVDLARDEDAPAEEREDVRLDLLIEGALERARRHASGTRFEARLEPCLVHGAPARLDRAVANLLDNAAKFGNGAGPVEVVLRAGGELTVRDRGPGIAAEDLPYVFDRFYRAADARGRAGSGLGLAIVRQVAESHGGTASAEAAPGGGALLRLRLPPASADAPASAER